MWRLWSAPAEGIRPKQHPPVDPAGNHAGEQGVGSQPMDGVGPGDGIAEVEWMANVPLAPASPSVAGRLGEMVASREWKVPGPLQELAMQARASLKERDGLTPSEQARVVQEQWPELWRELCLYEGRGGDQEDDLAAWGSHSASSSPWSQAAWEATPEAVANQQEGGHPGDSEWSYLDGNDPFLHHRPVPGLQSFLSQPKGYPPFHVI